MALTTKEISQIQVLFAKAEINDSTSQMDRKAWLNVWHNCKN